LNGARASGQLAGVHDGKLTLRRPGVDQQLAVPVAELRALATLRPRKPEFPPPGRLCRLEADGCRLRGVLVDGEARGPASCLVFQAQGSNNKSPLRTGLSGRVIYREMPPGVGQGGRPAGRLAVPRQAIQGRVIQRQANGVLRIVQAVRQPSRPRPAAPSREGDGELLWLQGGDRLPCKLRSIDEAGMYFDSPRVEADFLPHRSIKAWEGSGFRGSSLDEDKRERLLTLPRMQRQNPPTHLIESISGDFLRGQLRSMNNELTVMEVRLETKNVRPDQIARIIWLDGPVPADDNAAAALDQPPSSATSLQAVHRDGVRLTFVPTRVAKGVVHGQSELLGRCQVSLEDVDQLLLGDAIAAAAEDLTYHDWRLRAAPDPRFVEGATPEVGGESGLVGGPAPDFNLELLGGGAFKLSEYRGRVVVLDFWASWCGPCQQSMPQVDKIAQELDGQGVQFTAINLQEDRQTVSESVERLSLSLPVALDVDGAAAEKFAVTAIPQSVVINADGQVAAVLIGGRPDFAEQLREAIDAALNPADDSGNSTVP
jgi:thiol-disulfide isomerase/thioredoxin